MRPETGNNRRKSCNDVKKKYEMDLRKTKKSNKVTEGERDGVGKENRKDVKLNIKQITRQKKYMQKIRMKI